MTITFYEHLFSSSVQNANPFMIKRPVLELGGGKVLVGFKPEQYESAVAAGR